MLEIYTDYKNKELQQLGKNLNIECDNPQDNNYISLEENIHYYIEHNLFSLYDMFINNQIITYKYLKKLENSDFLKLFRYFEHQDNLDSIIKNNTTIININQFDKKFILLLFTINFVYYKQFNTHYHYYNNSNIFSDLEDYYINNSFNKTKNFANLTIQNIEKQFTQMCKKLILFISLTNMYYDNIPFDLIIYMILGTPKFMFLHY